MSDAVILKITGKVQGVFFRAETRNAAMGFGLTGYVKNMPDGSVLALVQGDKKNIESMIDWCHKGPPLSRVDGVTVETVPAKDGRLDFEIRY